MTNSKLITTLAALMILTANFAAATDFDNNPNTPHERTDTDPLPVSEIEISDNEEFFNSELKVLIIKAQLIGPSKEDPLWSEIKQAAQDPMKRDFIISELFYELNRDYSCKDNTAKLLAYMAVDFPQTFSDIVPKLLTMASRHQQSTYALKSIAEIAKDAKQRNRILPILKTAATSPDKHIHSLGDKYSAINLMSAIAPISRDAAQELMPTLINAARTEKLQGIRSSAFSALKNIAINVRPLREEVFNKLTDILREGKDELAVRSMIELAPLENYKSRVITEFIKVMEDNLACDDCMLYTDMMRFVLFNFAWNGPVENFDDVFRQNAANVILSAMGNRIDSQNLLPSKSSSAMEPDFKLIEMSIKNLVGENDTYMTLRSAANYNDFRAAVLAAGCDKKLISPASLMRNAKDELPQVRMVAVTELGRMFHELKFCRPFDSKTTADFDLQLNEPVKTTLEARIYELLHDVAANDADTEVKKLAAELIDAQGHTLIDLGKFSLMK